MSAPRPVDLHPATAAVEPGLLQQRPFRRLSFSRFFSRVAQNSLNFALVLLIVDETGLAVMSSLLVLALVIPQTAFGIVAGTAADVFPRRIMILFGNLARAAVCVFFVLSAGDVPSFYVVAVMLAAAAPFASTAEAAILPAIIEREDLARANAISHAVSGGAQLIGLGLLTPLVLRVLRSPDALFLICAGLFVAAAVHGLLIGRVATVSRQEVGGEHEGRWWLAGWRALRADQHVWQAAIELTLISASLIILGGLIPSYITDTLGLPLEVGVLILMPAAAGVVIGLRVAGFLAHRVPHGLLSTVGFAAFVAVLFAFTFVEEEASFLGGYGAFGWLNHINIGNFDGADVVAMVLAAPLGFSMAIVQVAAQTVLNDLVPLQLQGRAGATQAAMAGLASSIPVVLAGLLADLAGVTVVMALLAAAIGTAALMNLRQPRLKAASAAGMAH